PHPHIPLPADLYGAERRNSAGVDLADPVATADLAGRMAEALRTAAEAVPLVGGRPAGGDARPVASPADHSVTVGSVAEASAETVDTAIARAAIAAPEWNAVPPADRAALLERAADLYEAEGPRLMALVVREGGRTVPDALSELR